MWTVVFLRPEMHVLSVQMVKRISRSVLPVIKPNSRSVLQNFSLFSLRWVVAIYPSYALKECDGDIQDIKNEAWCTLIYSSYWGMKTFLHLGERWLLKHVAVKKAFVLLQTVVLTVLFLLLNVRKHNFMSSVKVI